MGIAARGQIYMGAPIGVVEIHLQLENAGRPHLIVSNNFQTQLINEIGL